MSLATAEKSKLLNGSLTQVTDKLEDGVRSARRAVKHGRDAVEDIIEETQHAVKRNPLGAVGIAFAAGILAGGVAAWLGSRRS